MSRTIPTCMPPTPWAPALHSLGSIRDPGAIHGARNLLVRRGLHASWEKHVGHQVIQGWRHAPHCFRLMHALLSQLDALSGLAHASVACSCMPCRASGAGARTADIWPARSGDCMGHTWPLPMMT